MTSDLRQVQTALTISAPVAKSDYLRWARSSDLAARARAFHLSATAWGRITPPPTMEEQGEVAADYLLACLATNPDGDDFVHSGFEAGRALASWLKHVAGIPEAAGVIQQVVRRLEQMYRASDVKSRNRIETGALEHALEDPRLRHFFEHWAGDPVLADAFNAALEWGIAHEDRAV